MQSSNYGNPTTFYLSISIPRPRPQVCQRTIWAVDKIPEQNCKFRSKLFNIFSTDFHMRRKISLLMVSGKFIDYYRLIPQRIEGEEWNFNELRKQLKSRSTFTFLYLST